MSLTINIYYTGKDGNARKFADEMVSSGLVDKIRAEPGNLGYRYFAPLDDPETILLVDQWENQEALDFHHKTPMMQEIADLRKKYHLSMRPYKFEAIS